MPNVKISDVAREAGVSIGTASNALNHPEKVRPETRLHIDAAIERLGYTPNQSARLLAGGRNATIAAVLPHLNDGFSLQIASGARREAHRSGYRLLIADAEDDEALEGQYLGSFMGSQVAAALIQPVARDGWAPPAHLASIPAVFLDARTEAPGQFIVVDSVAQGRIIAEHALQGGARRIAVIGSARPQQLGLRAFGIRSALIAQGSIRLEVIDAGAPGAADDGLRLGAELCRRAGSERPDFIIGLTDVLAAGAIAGAIEAGLRVPDEVKVAGCDGNPLAWGGAIPLTTCAPLGYEVGRKGIRLAIGQIERAAAPKIVQVQPGARRPGRADPRADIAPVHHEEIVKPFLLARASTRGDAISGIPFNAAEGNVHRSLSPQAPDLNLGAYL